jgi:DNA-directed RNA polymerase subunit RPC12/RpoP
MPRKEGIESADYLTCPYCAFVDHEAEEMFVEDGSDQREVDCRECGKTFTAIRHIEVYYSSFKDEEDGDANANG